VGKRSNFERIPRDFYPTPRAAVLPLIPHLRGIRRFAEPCAGDGDLIRHLESFGKRCVYAGDISTGQDALALTAADCNYADCGITNLPYKYPDDPPRTTRLMRDLIRHFLDIALPCWLILPHDFSTNENAAPFLPHCSDIVAVGRVTWIAGTKDTSKDNFSWYRFDSRHSCGPVLHNNRGQREVMPSRRKACEQCAKAYQPQRSSSRFCSETCRQRAHRNRVSVTVGVTADASEEFRYVLHADVPGFEAKGWESLPALENTHHGYWSTLMRRR
jgi:hypothetical protein